MQRPIFEESKSEILNSLYEAEKRYLAERRGLEEQVEQLRKELEEAKASKSTAYAGGCINSKPPLGQPRYITYKNEKYVKVERSPKVGDVINVTSIQSFSSEPQTGNELAKITDIALGGLILDHVVFGESSTVSSSAYFSDKYDAVYELAPSRINYDGNEYVKVNREPYAGDLIHITYFDEQRVDTYRILMEDGYIPNMDKAINGTHLFDFEDDEYDDVYELVQPRITYKGGQYVKVDRNPRKGDVINVTSMSDGDGETKYGAELAQVLQTYSSGDMDLDKEVFGANDFLAISSHRYNDTYDAVYEPVND
ncbi:hypothetical protein HB904_04205 [Listeria booriae]|uniref:Uncharacterized protein n=1 Tax=Listeria booriae TaxID=1552123 RepID=A0A842A918_9LIST|nr:hypothetical protein [Listeria booriae]MBC1615376.1 hypothetical protein [Listeria booriae]